MSLLAIEINDAGLTAVSESGVVYEAEGIAWLGEQGARFGAEAFARVRLEPDRVSAHHWQNLDQRPLARPQPAFRTHADVVFGHLEALWETCREGVDRVVFVLPGCYGREQLGLLLGMCGRLGIVVTGFVDSALAATQRSYPGAELVHLELCLHRAVLTRLEQGARLRRSRVEERSGIGIAAAREVLVKAIAGEFVREVRFDPLYRADSEQQLYQQLPDLEGAFREGESTVLVLDTASGSFRAKIARRMLERVLNPMVGTLCDFVGGQHFANVPMVVELSATARQIPGLTAGLRAKGYCVLPLKRGDGARGALALADQLPEGRAVFLSESPLPDVADLPVSDPSGGDGGKMAEPTHILYLDRAYPLGQRPLVIGRDARPGAVDLVLRDSPKGVSRRHCSVMIRDGAAVIEDHSTFGTSVNELQVTGRTRLRLGDTIRVGHGAAELRLIRVEPGEQS